MNDNIFDNFGDAMVMMAAATGLGTPTPGYADGSSLREAYPSHLYHSDRDALSCSLLKPLLVSPAHFRTELVAPYKRSDAKDFGSLLHLLLLEPELLGQEVAVYPGIAYERDRAYKTFAAENEGKLLFDEPTFSKARQLAQKVGETKYKGRLIYRFLEEAKTEVSIYFKDPATGLSLRIRPDIYHPDVTFDLKSTRHGTLSAFTRDAVELHYDLQAFMYSLGRSLYEGSTKAKPFVFLAAETTEPHSIQVQTAGDSFMSNGALKYQEVVSVYQACSSAGYWPDLSSEGTMEIDHWQQYKPNDLAPEKWSS